MTRAEIAIEKYENGYNCCQAVVCSFADKLGMDEEVLYKVAEGFGGGMGTSRGVCGAISGAAIASGLINSDGDYEHAGNTRARSTKAAGQMQKLFVEKVGALSCREIKTGNDGKPFASCQDCIKAAVETVEEVLGL